MEFPDFGVLVLGDSGFVCDALARPGADTHGTVPEEAPAA